MLNEKVIYVAQKIAQFYLELCNGNEFEANSKIEALRIKNIIVLNNEIIIETQRPGLLIGKRGENIHALTNYLGTRIKIYECPQSELEIALTVENYPTYTNTTYKDFLDKGLQ